MTKAEEIEMAFIDKAAIAFMQAEIGNQDWATEQYWIPKDYPDIAKRAYQMAMAMWEERKKYES